MRESKVEKYLVDELRKLNIETRKTKFVGVDGCPDRLIMVMGGIWVELKAPGEKPRPSQVRQIGLMRSRGFIVFVIDCREQVDALITFIKAGAS